MWLLQHVNRKRHYMSGQLIPCGAWTCTAQPNARKTWTLGSLSWVVPRIRCYWDGPLVSHALAFFPHPVPRKNQGS